MNDEYTSGPESDPVGATPNDPAHGAAAPPARMSPPPPPTPPTMRGDLSMPERQSAWPTVLGVIMVILGSLGALGGCFGLFSPLIGEAVMSVVPENDPGRASIEASFGHPGLMVGLSAVTMAVAILLLVAGIGLMRRKAWSRPASLTWAVVKMVTVLASAAIQYPMQQEAMKAQTEAIAASGGTAPAGLTTFMEGAVIFGLAFGVLWGWALPIFLLIWFNLKRKKAEIATWS